MTRHPMLDLLFQCPWRVFIAPVAIPKTPGVYASIVLAALRPERCRVAAHRTRACVVRDQRAADFVVPHDPVLNWQPDVESFLD